MRSARFPTALVGALERAVAPFARPGSRGGCAGRAGTSGSSCAPPACRLSTATSRSRATTPESELQSCSCPESSTPDYDPLAVHRSYLAERPGRRRAEPAPLPRREDVSPCLNLRTPTRWRWRRPSRCVCRCSTTSSSHSPRGFRRSEAEGLAAQVHLQAKPGGHPAARDHLAAEGRLRRAAALLARGDLAPLVDDLSRSRHPAPRALRSCVVAGCARRTPPARRQQLPALRATLARALVPDVPRPDVGLRRDQRRRQLDSSGR